MATSYVSPKAEAVPTQAGAGLRAAQRIEEGEVIVTWGGTVHIRASLDRLPAARRALSIQVEDELFVVPDDPGAADRVNHSCAPSARLRGQLTLVAARTLEPGDEITYDYATSDGSDYDEFDCLCGAPSCRKQVRGSDWSLPSVADRYPRDWFSPYLQARLARRHAR